jgi:hypothetical protein
LLPMGVHPHGGSPPEDHTPSQLPARRRRPRHRASRGRGDHDVGALRRPAQPSRLGRHAGQATVPRHCGLGCFQPNTVPGFKIAFPFILNSQIVSKF